MYITCIHQGTCDTLECYYYLFNAKEKKINHIGYETNHLHAHVSTEGSCSTVVLHLKKIIVLLVAVSS